jgi:uncharacterized protein (TIRG00374 family)
MKQRAKKWLLFVLRWSIAVAGIAWVISGMKLRDSALVILDPTTNRPTEVALVNPVGEDAQTFPVIDPKSNKHVEIPHDRVVNRPDVKQITIKGENGGTTRVDLLGLDLQNLKTVERFLISPLKDAPGVWIEPSAVIGYKLQVPRPRDETGLMTLLREAMGKPWFLWAAILVFPLTFVITSYRWNELLKAVDIRIGQSRTFVLNMVGAFYNTFMPGSTGGDLLKAYYVAKQTPHRTRAVMSVLVDRAIGLLALVILGGVMAGYQYLTAAPGDPASHATGKVALASLGIIVMAIVGLAVFYTPILRRITGLDFILSRLPMQKQVQKAVETMGLYRRRPLLALWSLIVTFPVHMTVVVSAMFAGFAFGLKLHPLYYWVAVPVIVLVGAIPISPQGAGVMEFFAILLTRSQGVSVSGAFALTNSIRLIQILWNLTGGVFVLRGGYHAPTETEKETLEEDGVGAPGSRIPQTAEVAAKA